MKFEKIKTWFRFSSTFSTDHSDLCNRPNGNALIGMYARLLALSVENDGIIEISLKAKITESIATLVNESDFGLVRKLISILYRFDYMEKLDNGSLFFREAKELSGKECGSAIRVRRYRERVYKSDRPLQCNTSDDTTPLQCNTNVTPVTHNPPYKNNINIPPQVSKDTKGISKDIPKGIDRRTNNKKRTCTCETPLELVQWLVKQGYITTVTKEWNKTVSECFSSSTLPLLVRITAERVAGTRTEVKDKLSYFKRTFGHIQKNPEQYVDDWPKLVQEHQEHLEQITKIAKTPWLTPEDKTND